MSVEEKRADWTAPVWGALLSLGVYLAGAAILAWAVYAGVTEDGGAALAVLGLLAAFLGGVRGQGKGGGLPNALASAGLFALVLAAAGLACWRELAWRGQGGMTLLCILAGGLLAALLRGRKKKKRRFR